MRKTLVAGSVVVAAATAALVADAGPIIVHPNSVSDDSLLVADGNDILGVADGNDILGNPGGGDTLG